MSALKEISRVITFTAVGAVLLACSGDSQDSKRAININTSPIARPANPFDTRPNVAPPSPITVKPLVAQPNIDCQKDKNAEGEQLHFELNPTTPLSVLNTELSFGNNFGNVGYKGVTPNILTLLLPDLMEFRVRPVDGVQAIVKVKPGQRTGATDAWVNFSCQK